MEYYKKVKGYRDDMTSNKTRPIADFDHNQILQSSIAQMKSTKN